MLSPVCVTVYCFNKSTTDGDIGNKRSFFPFPITLISWLLINTFCFCIEQASDILIPVSTNRAINSLSFILLFDLGQALSSLSTSSLFGACRITLATLISFIPFTGLSNHKTCSSRKLKNDFNPFWSFLTFVSETALSLSAK